MDRTTPSNLHHQSPTPTVQTYISLETAFAILNARLFNCCLPYCLITLKTKTGAGGFFAGSRFVSRDERNVIDEIALNPMYFAKQSDKEILAILGHEMCHLWQHHFGKRPKRVYHDLQWAEKMISIGLVPSCTGMPDGRQTGVKMGHYVQPDGMFDLVSRELLTDSTVITYVERTDATRRELGQKKRASKSTFVCPGCKWQIWGKPDTRVRCDGCNELLVVRATL